MSPRWGRSPWRVGDAAPPAPAPAHCDVAVVGAGLTGLSAALHLARRGVRAHVFEAGRIGDGASGRTGAIVLEGTAGGPLPEVSDTIDGLARLVREASIDCALALPGCRELVHHPASADDRPLWRDGEGALYVTSTVPGGTVDAGALLAGLASAATRAGVAIHQHRPVLGLVPGAPAVLRLEDAEVRADRVVLALNAYTPRLLPAPELVRAALALAACTAPLDHGTLATIGLGDGLPFYTVDLPYLWGRPLPDGRVIFGSGLVFDPGGDLDAIDVEAGEARATLDRLEERIRRLHPALASVRVANRWAGPIAIPVRRRPVLGRHPEATTVIVTGGYAGHGVALAVRVGELAARALTEGKELPSWGAL